MESRKSIIKKVNQKINKILEELFEIFTRLKVTDTSLCNEMGDLVIIKRKFTDLTDIILTIFNDIVKLKYLYLKENKNDEFEKNKKNINEDFEKLMKNLNEA